MAKRRRKQAVHKLRNLFFYAVHLVKSPANRRRLLLVKSLSTGKEGGENMPKREGPEEKEKELEELEFEEVPELEFEELDEEETEGLVEALNKALDIIKGEQGEEVEKAQTKLLNAAKGALRIISKYAEDPKAPAWLKAAAKSLASGLGYGKPEKPKEEKPEEKVEKASDEVVKAALKVFQKVWDKLPKEAQSAVDKLAADVGYPEYGKPEEDKEGYPEVKKSVEFVTLEKAHGELMQRLEKAESQLQEAEKKARLAELEPIAKGTGLDAETLYELEGWDEKRAKSIISHVEALQKRVEVGELFVEKGTAAPVEGTPSGLVHAAALEMVEKGEAKDYGTALAELSANPKYRDTITRLMGHD